MDVHVWAGVAVVGVEVAFAGFEEERLVFVVGKLDSVAVVEEGFGSGAEAVYCVDFGEFEGLVEVEGVFCQG